MTCFPRQILICFMPMRYIDHAQLWKTAGGEGVIDGTVWAVCSPEENQRDIYNGHSIEFQSVALPNGLVDHLSGPVEKKRHDSGRISLNFIRLLRVVITPSVMSESTGR